MSGPRRTRQAAVALTLLVGLSAILSGCAARDEPSMIGKSLTPGPSATRSSEGVGTSSTVDWIETGESFSVTAYGSSTCPQVPTAVTGSAQAINVELTVEGGPICTSDLKRASYALDVPRGVDTSAAVTVTVTEDDGTTSVITLPGASG